MFLAKRVQQKTKTSDKRPTTIYLGNKKYISPKSRTMKNTYIILVEDSCWNRAYLQILSPLVESVVLGNLRLEDGQ